MNRATIEAFRTLAVALGDARTANRALDAENVRLRQHGGHGGTVSDQFRVRGVERIPGPGELVLTVDLGLGITARVRVHLDTSIRESRSADAVAATSAWVLRRRLWARITPTIDDEWICDLYDDDTGEHLHDHLHRQGVTGR